MLWLSPPVELCILWEAVSRTKETCAALDLTITKIHLVHTGHVVYLLSSPTYVSRRSTFILKTPLVFWITLFRKARQDVTATASSLHSFLSDKLTPSEAAASQPKLQSSVLTSSPVWLSLNTFTLYINIFLIDILTRFLNLITQSGSPYKYGRKWNAPNEPVMWIPKCWQFARLWFVRSSQNRALIGQTLELAIPFGWSLSWHSHNTDLWSLEWHW